MLGRMTSNFFGFECKLKTILYLTMRIQKEMCSYREKLIYGGFLHAGSIFSGITKSSVLLFPLFGGMYNVILSHNIRLQREQIVGYRF